MRTQWTIGQKLHTGIAALLALFVVLAGVAIHGTNSVNQRLSDAVTVTTHKLELVKGFETIICDLRGLQRRELLAGYGNEKEIFDASKKAIGGRLQEVRDSARDITPLLKSDDERQALSELTQNLEEWNTLNAQVEAKLGEGLQDDARNLAKNVTNVPVLKAEKAAATLVAVNNRQLKQAEADAAGTFRNALYLTVIVSILALMVGMAVAITVRRIVAALRATTDELKGGAMQVSSASVQISNSSQSLSQGATEQAASLEESSASMEEMASMTRQNAENAGQASSVMADVDRRVQEADQMLQEMVGSMDRIKESSQKVAKIIKTIDDIAFQTNILALNAAVEAARAGEAGMGFAVVAGEVRNLAQRSAEASKDTAALIEESVTNAEHGTQKVSQVAAAINGFTGSIAKVRTIADQVSQASRQQTQGIDQVSQAISQMEKVTQTTAALAEESAAASEELNNQAGTTLELVVRLETMVTGNVAATSRHDTVPAPRPTTSKVVRLAPPTPKQGTTPKPNMVAADAALHEGTGTFGTF